MAITDRTRKLLWGRSGNRCAICKQEMVIDRTEADPEAVVGDECHIISRKPNGPRYDPSLLEEERDAHDNLILLCRVHHKMVDDQPETYTVQILRQLKSNHEVWVSGKLSESQRPMRPRFRRVKQNIPTSLARLRTGSEVLAVVEGSCALSAGHDELDTQVAADLVASLFDTAKDWSDLADDLGPGRRVQIAFDLTQTLQSLEALGLFVFGAVEVQSLEGGMGGPVDWPVAILRVIHGDNKNIVWAERCSENDNGAQPAAPPETPQSGDGWPAHVKCLAQEGNTWRGKSFTSRVTHTLLTSPTWQAAASARSGATLAGRSS
jgi:hypothetical protein